MARTNRVPHKLREGGGGPRGGPLLPPPATQLEARARAKAASNAELAAAIRHLDQVGHLDKSFRSFGMEYACRDELDARFGARLHEGPLTAAEIAQWTEWIPDPPVVYPASATVANSVAYFTKHVWKTGATVTTMTPKSPVVVNSPPPGKSPAQEEL